MTGQPLNQEEYIYNSDPADTNDPIHVQGENDTNSPDLPAEGWDEAARTPVVPVRGISLF